ncbi:MAG: ATP-grasp domain-containing protein [Dehalococcoidia bacterium]
MHRVLLLIPSASYRAPDFMNAAARLGVEVAVGSNITHPLGDRSTGLHVGLDFADVARGTGQIEALADHHPIDSIIAVDDAGVRLAAAASRRLELPHNSVRSVEATRNKALLRRRLAEGGVPSPAYRVVRTSDAPRDASAGLEYPVVLKPLALAASRGVIRANDAAEFADAFERIKRILQEPDNARDCGPLAGELLVESFIPGDEVSLEGILESGRLTTLAIFDKPDPLDGPFFEETIYLTPPRLPEETQVLIERTASDACQALGLGEGPVHAELRINERGAFPIDIAARSIGGLCGRTLTFGTGLSLEELIISHAIGEPIVADRVAGAAGVMMIPIPAGGILRSISGLEGARAIPFIESIDVPVRKGSRVIPLPEGGDYLGFIFSSGPDPDTVETALRDAHSRLAFEIVSD